ncbi:MAG: AmmeMemoRadiSam system protein B [Mycobacterium leprae]
MSRRPLVAAVVLALVLVAWLGARAEAPTPAAPPAAPAKETAGMAPAEAGTQPNQFFDAAYFYPGLDEARQAPAPRGEGRLVGGLTSHHGVAGGVIAQLFLEVGERPPATVILVGPNHANRGQQAITGRRSWATDFGPVETDQALVDRLVAAGLATVDEETLSPEHAMGALMPYVKYVAPHAKVVPLILSRSMSLADVRALAQFLAPLTGPDRPLIASVDFSHYLTAAEAEEKDEVTLAAIQQRDLDALWRMGPEYLDSPQSLGLLLLTMQTVGASGPEIAAHTNSGRLLRNPALACTSYFTFKYRDR